MNEAQPLPASPEVGRWSRGASAPDARWWSGSLRDWLTLVRPRQWTKNLLVAAAPLAAGRWTATDTISDIALGFMLFTVTAVGCYLVNDALDAHRDRWHPVKRRRPVAAGQIRPRSAAAVGGICLVAGPAIALASGYPTFAVALLGYGGLTLGYSLGLKRVPFLELAVLSTGFLLRPLAGAAVTQIRPSGWFLIVTGAGAVMVAAGKRAAELATPGVSERHRRSLRSYSGHSLQRIQVAAAGVLVAAYVGWALTRRPPELPFALLSLVAVTVAIARFLWRSRRGDGAAPEELLLRDRWLLLSASVWIAVMLAGSLRA